MCIANVSAIPLYLLVGCYGQCLLVWIVWIVSHFVNVKNYSETAKNSPSSLLSADPKYLRTINGNKTRDF